MEHVRKFKRGYEKTPFNNHANIITSLLRTIYEAQDKNQLVYIKGILYTYVLGMSLPKTIDWLYTKKEGLPQSGKQGKTEILIGRPIFRLIFYGKPVAVPISVGTNGFVIGMNRSSRKTFKKMANLTYD